MMPDGDKLCLFITLKSTTCKAAKESCWVSTPIADTSHSSILWKTVSLQARDALLQVYILQKNTAAVSAVSGSYD